MVDFKEVVCSSIDKLAEDLYQVSNFLWSNPEESLEEVRAHDKITDFLEKKGFPVERNFVLPTGFRSVIGSSSVGPHIAFLCEYDALPKIGHACGHNLIAQVGLAAGIGLKAAMEASNNPFGKITILGTPAEESSGGKLDMIKHGVFKDVDAAFMAHPAPFNDQDYNTLAMEEVFVRYYGKAAHASAFPWNGVNALDAAILCYQNVSCYRQQFKPTWRVHGVIIKGGDKPNIIPDFTELEFYARTPRKEELHLLKDKLNKCFESAASATGCSVEISWKGKPYYDMRNNKTIAGLYKKYAVAMGIDFDNHGTAEFGTDVPTGSTDMGNVSYEVPSIHPMYFIGSKAELHTKEFTIAAGSEEAQQYTLKVAKAIAMTAIDIMTQTELMKTVTDEFKFR